MDAEEIKKLIDGHPDEMIKKGKELGIDFDANKKAVKEMVMKACNLNKKQSEAVDFVFWISYFVEYQVEQMIIIPEVKVGGREKAIKILVNKLHFGDKIDALEKLYLGKKTITKLMRIVQNMRNDIAHGRFDNLKYKGYDLSDGCGQLKLILDLRNAFKKIK